MEQADVDPSSVPAASIPGRGLPLWVRGLAFLAMVGLVGYIGHAGRAIWAEWSSLREDQVGERDSAVVGYIGINPEVSLASKPNGWSHDEGDQSLLWAGWKDGEHHWFRYGRGDLDTEQLSMPIGRDTIRAVDYPLYERDGGPRWGRVPVEAPVVGFEHDGQAIAYPMRVLDKVMVVNDQVGDRPLLVIFQPKDSIVSAYEATFEGRRVTLGHGGYFFPGYRAILYDRGTESLWSEGEGGMVALAGRRKGASLKRIARLNVVAWGDWRDKHPDGRLLVGADRSKAPPGD